MFLISFVLLNGEKIVESFLIDRSADISVITYDFGKSLGFIRESHEVLFKAEGIGGSIDYILKETEIEINGFRFMNHFAWLQDPDLDDMIIGRDTVFDLFDIEFRQADEEIEFKNRV